MRLKKFILSWQVLLLIFFIVLSIIAINPNFSSYGITITSVGSGVFSGKLSPGMVVYSAGLAGNEMKKIYKLEDLLEFQGKEGYLILETNKGKKTVRLEAGDVFNISAKPIERSNLKFGLDIEGGIRALLEPNLTNGTEIDEIIDILETRINICLLYTSPSPRDRG